MQIWFFIKWLGRKLCKTAYWFCQIFVGWFILGRGCNRCKHRKYSVCGWTGDCLLDLLIKIECQRSIARKHFEKERGAKWVD